MTDEADFYARFGAEEHCADVQKLRDIGEWAEREFCRIAAEQGKMFIALQIGRATASAAYYQEAGNIHPLLTPDVIIYQGAGQHHEVKTKLPNKYGNFGLEKYRLDALLKYQQKTGDEVCYTILDWSRAGGKYARTRIEHWQTIAVSTLEESLKAGEARVFPGKTLVRGAMKTGVPICFWPTRLWHPLADHWQQAKSAAPASPAAERPADFFDRLRWAGSPKPDPVRAALRALNEELAAGRIDFGEFLRAAAECQRASAESEEEAAA